MISTSTIRPAPLPWVVKSADGRWCLLTSPHATAPVLHMQRREPTCAKCRGEA